MASGIYAITNTTNGKVYIGSTNDFDRRWWEHRNDLRKCNHGNSYLQSAWNKYGKDAFEFGVLEYLDNFEELVRAEQFWMDLYREEGKKLYNFGLAADNALRGRILGPPSEEHRRKNSESHKGKKHSKEQRRKNSEAHMGNQNALGSKCSDEHKCKISKANKGNQHFLGHKHTKESKQKMSRSHKGKKVSKKTRRRMSEAAMGNQRALGRVVSEESRRKSSETQKGRVFTEEHRRNMSKAQKARWAKDGKNK